MASKRQQQSAEMVKRNFSMVLQQEGNYIYDNALVTVTSVTISPDLSVAKIYLSIYNVEDKQSVILQLKENYTRLRQGLAYRLKKQMRRVPHFELFLDDTLDEMYSLNNLFDKLYEENHMPEEE